MYDPNATLYTTGAPPQQQQGFGGGDPNATLIGSGAAVGGYQQQAYPPPAYSVQPQQRFGGGDPNATLIGSGAAVGGYAPPQQQRYGGGDPNATLIGSGAAVGGYAPQQQRYGGDPNATLIGSGAPVGQYQTGGDPNATLIGMAPQQQQRYGGDPNATLIGQVGGGGDPNATLIGQVGGGDPNATLIGAGAPVFVNNSALFQQQASQQPQVIPHFKMVPHNNFFPIVERDLIRTLKFGRQGEQTDPDPDFFCFNSRVVSRRHAEVWAVNGEFYIRDTRSQSGTFLNAMRLSLPGEESKPFKLKNGDTVQFGVDRKGGTTPDTKCVSVTVELSFKKNAPAAQPAPPGYSLQQQAGYPSQGYPPQQGYPQQGYPPQGQFQQPSPPGYSPQQARPNIAPLSDLTLISSNRK